MRYPRFLLLTAAVGAAALTSGCSQGEAFPVRTYPMGDKIELGHIIYTVFETQWLTHVGEAPNERVPQNRFFLVRMSAVNSGGSEVIVPNVTIEDDTGKTYPELSDGSGIPQWIGFLRQVKPADSVQGNVLFDAPPKHYKLRVTDESGERAALVDIPLSFGAETPGVVDPSGAAKKQ